MPRLSKAALRALIAADYERLEGRRLARLRDDAAAARERAGWERVRPGETARGPRRRRDDRLLPAPEPDASPQTEPDSRQGELFPECPALAPAETPAVPTRLRPPADRSAILDAISPVSSWYLPITTKREGR